MKKRIREYIKQFFLIDDTPHKVAGGAALGIFLGIMPGEGVLATLLFAYIFRLNRLAALAGVLAVNMWTLVFVLPIAAAVGGLIFRVDPKLLSNDFHETATLGWKYLFSWNILRETAVPLLVGYAVFAGAIALLVYFSLLYLLIKRKHLQKDSHLLAKKQP
ncbi:MAG: DUF2062 domain-containing protein [Candidatus Moranbacteria bacterium]|nr:DUF2062 domain-containing protein [Candidatus Moranbacteria bacterium]